MKKLLIAMAALLTLGLLAFAMPQEQKNGGPWKISTEYKNKKNPYTVNDDLLKIGKDVYAKHCRSCHGNAGKGDGPKARNLKTHPGDFTDAAWQASVTDGEVYYMSIIGRDEMPNYETKITDEEERWAVVAYIRSLKK